MSPADRAMLALQRYLRANRGQRIGKAVYNIAREASGEHCPSTSAVFIRRRCPWVKLEERAA